jgi:hypothetical protein
MSELQTSRELNFGRDRAELLWHANLHLLVGASSLSLLAGAVSNRSEAYLMGLGALVIGRINRVRLEKLVEEKTKLVDALVGDLFKKVPTQKGQ